MIFVAYRSKSFWSEYKKGNNNKKPAEKRTLCQKDKQQEDAGKGFE